MRPEVAKSWQRSAAAGVPVDAAASPITLAAEDLDDAREAHPLALVYPVLEEVLGHAARSCDALLALSDQAGQLLWVTGTNEVLRRAEQIGFVEGSNWDERVAGTNAPGLALTLDRTATILGEEHYREVVRSWNCVATPIHDPSSGQVIGVLDITGGPAVTGPQTIALVQTAARLAEAELSRAARGMAGAVLLGAAPTDQDRGSAPIALHLLGRRQGLLSLGGRVIELGLRHSEVLTILSRQPLGLSGDELAIRLYPGEMTSSTIRAEMNRLRSLVGDEVIGSRPYRLRVEFGGDWHTVEAYLASGDLAGALRHYRGPLLPGSQAPGVIDLRDRLESELRRAILDAGRLDLMTTWTRTSWGADDYEMWVAQTALLPGTSPLASLARAQVDRLDRELGTHLRLGR